MTGWQRIRKPWRHWDEAVLRRNIGVYLHIPFCLHRCSYCDFLTYGNKRPQGLTPPAYVEALLDEIRLRGEWAWQRYGQHGRFVDTVFFGGGTPTYLDPEVLEKLVRAVYEHFPVAGATHLADACQEETRQVVGQAAVPVKDSQSVRDLSSTSNSDRHGGLSHPSSHHIAKPYEIEFTVEANPDTLTRDYLDILAEAGVNRLSVGVQATQTRHLRLMQRTHRWHDIEPRLAWLAAGPIPRYSFDLIYGLPGMTVTEVKTSLGRLLQFGPRHISAYELIYETGTPLHRWLQRFRQQELPEGERLAQHRAIGRLLAGHGLYRYEISNYATPGEESRHNLRYWRGGDYIGLGIGAASRFGTDVVNNPRSFEKYREFIGATGSGTGALASRGSMTDERVRPTNTADLPVAPTAPPADIFMRMRTRAGMHLNGQRPEGSWLTRGWLRQRNGHVEVTDAGLAFADLYHKEMA